MSAELLHAHGNRIVRARPVEMRDFEFFKNAVRQPRDPAGEGLAVVVERAAELFLRQSFHRIRRFLAELTDNDDEALLATANSVLGKSEPRAGLNGK